MKTPEKQSKNAIAWSAYESAVPEVAANLDALPEKIRSNEKKILDDSCKSR